jgi:hypothetical protein
VASAVPRSWTGPARLPCLVGGYEPRGVRRAVLEISSGRLDLRVPPGFVKTYLGMEDLTATPGDGVELYPAREVGRWGRPGIAIVAPQFRPRRWNLRWGRLGAPAPPCYFLTRERDAVLAAAVAAGFEVHDLEWSIEPRDSGS